MTGEYFAAVNIGRSVNAAAVASIVENGLAGDQRGSKVESWDLQGDVKEEEEDTCLQASLIRRTCVSCDHDSLKYQAN